MKVFIVGGTGLLGAAGAKELISRGHSVKSVALPPLPKGADIPQEMELTFDNILKMSDEQLKEMLTGCDGFVFAGGVDERIEFPPPVYDYYYKYNIAPVAKLLKIAKSAGVKKAVILGSYFSYFAKLWPEKRLCDKHPYIRSRIDQENVALSFSDDKFEVMVLELPYIFGAMKGRKPVWMFLINMLLNMKNNVYYPKGGTTMVTVKQTGQCIAGALERGLGGTCYPVGMYNMKWKEMLKIMLKNIGAPDKKIVTIPTMIYKLSSYVTRKKYIKQGIEPGLNPVDFVQLMTADTFISGKVIKESLGVEEDDIDAAIGDSVMQCLEIKKNNSKDVVTMKAE